MSRFYDQWLRYPFVDYRRGLLTILSCLVSVLISLSCQLPMYFSLWFVISATLTGLARAGDNKLQQTFYFLLFAILGALSCSLTTLAHSEFHYGAFYLAFFLLLLIILSLPRLLSGLSIAAIFFSVYAILAANFPVEAAHLGLLRALYQALGVISGTLVCAVVNLALPRLTVPAMKVDRGSYLFKRAFRISVGITLGFVIARIFHFSHASWIGFAVLVVSQMNLGASVRRAGQRLLGTFAGIVVGIPASLWLFGPYPQTRWLVVVLMFICFVITMRHYATGIFFVTFSLAALYYSLSISQDGAIPFIIDRFFETLIGVVIALLAEMIIFPRSLLPCMRMYLKHYWASVYYAGQDLMGRDCAACQQHLTLAKNKLDLFNEALLDFKYEPLGFLTKRYHYVLVLNNKLHHVLKRMSFLPDMLEGKNDWKTSVYFQLLTHISQVFKRLYETPVAERQHYLEERYAECQGTLQQLRRDHPELTAIEKRFLTIIQKWLVIMEQYLLIYQTPVWHGLWRLKRGRAPLSLPNDR